MGKLLASKDEMKKYHRTMRLVAPLSDDLKRQQGNTIRVLLMEDDLTVLQLLLKVLSLAGYQPTIVRDAQKQLQSVDTDIILVDVEGITVGKKNRLFDIREKFPDASILVTSGAPLSQVDYPVANDRNMKFLRKPYLLEELLRILSDWQMKSEN